MTPFASQTYSAKNKSTYLPWILINAILWVFFLVFMLGRIFDLWSDFQEIDNMDTTITNISQDKSDLERKLEKKETVFTQTAGGYLEREKVIFPASVDAHDVARTVEIIVLYLDSLDSSSQNFIAQINSLSFGDRRMNAKKNYAETSISLDIEMDADSFKDFIAFLQHGTIPPRLVQQYEKKDKNFIDNGDFNPSFEYIRENPIPLMHITRLSIEKTEIQGASRLLNRDGYKASLDGLIFSQSFNS